MKIKNYTVNKTTFSSLEIGLQEMIQKILSNDRLKKLMYRSDKHCLADSCPNLTNEETKELIEKEYITFNPHLKINNKNGVTLKFTFDSFISNEEDGKDFLLAIDIMCPITMWTLDNFQIRPYKIAGELDGMFDNSPGFGGKFMFLGANQVTYNVDVAGVIIFFQVSTSQADTEKEFTASDMRRGW